MSGIRNFPMASIRNCTGPLAVLLSLPFLLGADQKAKTENGREVILHDDGTWTYLKAPKPDKKTGAGNEFKKDKQAVLQYKSRRGTFALHLIPGAWRKADKPVNPSAEVQFTHADGDV